MLIIGSLESREIIKKKEKKKTTRNSSSSGNHYKIFNFFLSKLKKALIYISKRVLFLRVVLFDIYACTPTMLLKTFLESLSGPI